MGFDVWATIAHPPPPNPSTHPPRALPQPQVKRLFKQALASQILAQPLLFLGLFRIMVHFGTEVQAPMPTTRDAFVQVRL